MIALFFFFKFVGGMCQRVFVGKGHFLNYGSLLDVIYKKNLTYGF